MGNFMLRTQLSDSQLHICLQAILGPIILRRRKDSKTASGRPSAAPPYSADLRAPLVALPAPEISRMRAPAVVQLPPKTISVVEVALSAEERDFYTHIEQTAAAQFKKFMKSGEVSRATRRCCAEA